MLNTTCKRHGVLNIWYAYILKTLYFKVSLNCIFRFWSCFLSYMRPVYQCPERAQKAAGSSGGCSRDRLQCRLHGLRTYLRRLLCRQPLHGREKPKLARLLLNVCLCHRHNQYTGCDFPARLPRPRRRLYRWDGVYERHRNDWFRI